MGNLCCFHSSRKRESLDNKCIKMTNASGVTSHEQHMPSMLLNCNVYTVRTLQLTFNHNVSTRRQIRNDLEGADHVFVDCRVSEPICNRHQCSRRSSVPRNGDTHDYSLKLTF